MKKILLIISLSLLSPLLQSCSKDAKEASLNLSDYDLSTGLSRKDYKDTMLGKKPEKEEVVEKDNSRIKNAPDFQDLLRKPTPPKVAPEKLISLSVTEDVPLKSVLIELSRLSGVEMELDPDIRGGVILMVKDRPFDEVIRKIAEMANLRYSVSNGLLKMEMDSPYIVNYDLKFLDMTRTNATSLEITTTTGNDDLTSGGSTSIATASVSNIWIKLKDDLEAIIDGNDDNYITVINEDGEEEEEDLGTQFVKINMQAGIITVKTSEKVHGQVAHYLSMVRRSISSQVLIEAKIVEVTLNDTFQTGIEWSEIPEVTNGNFNSVSDDELFLGLNISDSRLGFNAAVSLLDKFGTTRTLASPRISAINNQQAVLSFTENQIYFEVEYDESTTTAETTTTATGIESTMQTLPVGIIVTMLPSIDYINRSVALNIRPTISVSTSSVSDPAVQLISLELSDSSDTVTSEIPEVSVKEMDTVLNIKDRQIAVMGGLIDQKDEITESGVPILKDIPILGSLFKSYKKEFTATETVLFIKATIIDDDNGVDEHDKDFYKTFSTDPRPLVF